MEKIDPSASRDPEIRQILAGIKLVLGEIHDLKRESRVDYKRAEEDRRRAEEDRKRAEEDRKRAEEKFEEYHRETAERFERYYRESSTREKDLSKALVIIGKVGREIVQTQHEHTRLLTQILKTLQGGANGHYRNNGGRGGNGKSH